MDEIERVVKLELVVRGCAPKEWLHDLCASLPLEDHINSWQSELSSSGLALSSAGLNVIS